MDLIIDENVEIAFIQETWLKKSDGYIIKQIEEYGYRIISERNERLNDLGGGIATIFKKNLNFKKKTYKKTKSFEFLSVFMNTPHGKCTFTNIYYPGYSPKHKFTKASFLNEFDKLLLEELNDDGLHTIVGDFNIHFQRPELDETSRLMSILGKYGYQQVVSNKTHIHGGMLDLIMYNKKMYPFFNKISVTDTIGLSDHHVINVNMSLNLKNAPKKIQVKSHRLTEEQVYNVISIIKQDPELSHSEEVAPLNEMVNRYNANLSRIFSMVCPKKMITVQERAQQKWFSQELKQKKLYKRQKERAWLKDKSNGTKLLDYENAKTNYYDSINATREK